jgi:hypothetical protein
LFKHVSFLCIISDVFLMVPESALKGKASGQTSDLSHDLLDKARRGDERAFTGIVSITHSYRIVSGLGANAREPVLVSNEFA